MGTKKSAISHIHAIVSQYQIGTSSRLNGTGIKPPVLLMKVNWLGGTQDITMVAANNTMQMKPGIRAVLLSTSVLAITSIAIPAASAEQDSSSSGYKLGSDITIEQAASLLHYSGGNDRFRVEIAPNYSEELGFSLKGAAGGYLTDAMALGLIVEYGENKREYLANAGIQFNESLSFVGTVGLLEEHNEYVDGEGREEAQQMEYGASLKGAYEVGFLSGFELNGYLADADSDSDSVETGKLYGVQLLAGLDLTETTHLKLGGGYEWLEWDDTNDDDSRWTFSADAAQQLGDVISLTGHARLGASEYVYGGGLAFDLSNGGMNTNSLGVNVSYIDGRNGIEDDQRVEFSWTFGFGAGPSTSVAAADLTDKSGTIRAAADVAVVSPSSNLLNDVMKRPNFLPERVLARSKSAGVSCPLVAMSRVTETGLWASGATWAEGNYYLRGMFSYVYFVEVDPAANLSIAPDESEIPGWTFAFNGEQTSFYDASGDLYNGKTVYGAGLLWNKLDPVTFTATSTDGRFFCSFDMIVSAPEV